MALSATEDALLASMIGLPLGDSAKRRALKAYLAEEFGFVRSGDTYSGRQLAPAAANLVGTAGTGVTAEEYGDAVQHFTKLTLTAVAMGTGDDDTDKAIGALIYTLPAGTIMCDGGSVKGIFDQASHGIISDGEIGLGTVIASGAVSVLSGTSTFNNILVGTQGTAIMTNYTLGTTVAEVAGLGVGAQPFTILAAAAHTVHLNLGADWPNIAAAEAVTFTGIVTLRWRIIS